MKFIHCKTKSQPESSQQMGPTVSRAFRHPLRALGSPLHRACPWSSDREAANKGPWKCVVYTRNLLEVVTWLSSGQRTMVAIACGSSSRCYRMGCRRALPSSDGRRFADGIARRNPVWQPAAPFRREPHETRKSPENKSFLPNLAAICGTGPPGRGGWYSRPGRTRTCDQSIMSHAGPFG